jgi:drug/metabolite transporter (DMT)-like permease
MRHAVGERVRFSRSRASDYQQWAGKCARQTADTVFDCDALRGIELFQVLGGLSHGPNICRNKIPVLQDEFFRRAAALADGSGAPHPSTWSLLAWVMRARTLLAFAIVYVVWGSTYLFIRYAVQTIPPFLLTGTRFIVAGTLLSAWALLRGAERPTRANWKAIVIIGVLFFPCANAVVVWAETRIGSGIAALLVAVEPLWVAVLLTLFTRRRPPAAVLAGIVLGLLGLVVLVGPKLQTGKAGVDLTVALALMGASCSWAAGSVYGRTAPLPRAPLLAAGLEMLVGGIGALLVGILAGEPRHLLLAAVSERSIIALAYLTVLGSLVAFTAYNWLVTVEAPARVATYAYVNPVIAVLLGAIVAGEPLTPRIGIAAVVIVTAVVLVIVGQSRSQPGVT